MFLRSNKYGTKYKCEITNQGFYDCMSERGYTAAIYQKDINSSKEGYTRIGESVVIKAKCDFTPVGLRK